MFINVNIGIFNKILHRICTLFAITMITNLKANTNIIKTKSIQFVFLLMSCYFYDFSEY